MNIAKKIYMAAFRQLLVRKNLYQIRDRRTFAPMLDRTLQEAAVIWPEVIPWRPRTILDVGANRGSFAEQISQLYRPNFIGLVEPLPQMASALQRNSFAPRQKVFSCAVGRKEGTATLNVLASSPSSSLLEVTAGCDALFNRPMNKVDCITVPVRTLDSIFLDCALKDLDLLKIDVQGYEIEAFSGGLSTLSNTRLVVTEVSFFHHYAGQPLFQEVYNVLHQAGFELRATFGFSYDSQGLPLQCDAVFINRRKPTPDK